MVIINIPIRNREDAELSLYKGGKVIHRDTGDVINGKSLMQQCGMALFNTRKELARQIEAHGLIKNIDYFAEPKKAGSKSIIYVFTIESASRILLSVITELGKLTDD